MICAKLFPEPEGQGRGKKALAAKAFPMVNPGSLSLARLVITYAPDLVDSVIGGGRNFKIREGNLEQATLSDIGVTAKELHAEDLSSIIRKSLSKAASSAPLKFFTMKSRSGGGTSF